MRLNRREQLGATVITGLVCALLAGYAFGAVAEDVLNRDSLTRYDAGMGQWLLNHATTASSWFFFGVTQLGGIAVVAGATGLLGLWFAWRKQWRWLLLFALAIGGGTLLEVTLKNYFLRQRPEFSNAFYHETGYSFPSGHSMMSVLFYGIVAYWLVRTIPHWRQQVAFALGAATLALLIGFSRLYLGVHYLTDVLGGWAAGLTWLAACLSADHLLRSADPPQPSS